MIKEAFLLGYMHKESSERLKNIRGYNPETRLLDMKENLRGTYGSSLEEELAKASQYADKNDLPFDIGKGYAGRLHAREDKKIKSPRIQLSPSGNLGMILPNDVRKGDEALTKAYPGLKIPENPLQQYIRHEAAHAATISPKAVRGKYSPSYSPETMHKRLGIPEESYTPYFRGSSMRRQGTYPEKVGPETIPPLAAIQQHVFSSTGKRIESPEEYDAYVKQLEAITPDNRQKLPMDIQRFLLNRETMREAGKKPPLQDEPEYNEWMRNRLKDYDRHNRRIIPGIVEAKAEKRRSTV